MAISRGNTVTFSTASPTNPMSISHTVNASSTKLVVGFEFYGTVASVTSVSATKGGIDTSMTQFVNGYKRATSDLETYLYYMDNPDTGAITIKINFTSSPASHIAGGAADYLGVAAGEDASASDRTTAQSYTASVTTVADNCWLVWAGRHEGGDGTWTPDANTNIIQHNSNLRAWFADTNTTPVTPAGSNSLNIDFANSSENNGCMGSIAPAAAATVIKRKIRGHGISR